MSKKRRRPAPTARPVSVQPGTTPAKQPTPPAPQRRPETSLSFDAGGSRWWLAAAWLWVLLVIMAAAGGPAPFLNGELPWAADQLGQNWWLTTWASRAAHGSPFGWSAQMGAGFPFGYFYFPLPPLLFTLLNLAVPASVAVKLVVLGGAVLVPAGLWRLAAGLGVTSRAQAGILVASTAFLLTGQATLAGGNLLSTFMGEFSYAYALGFGLWFLGVYAAALHRRGPWWPVPLLAAATVLSHAQAAVGIAVLAAVLTGLWGRKVRTVLRAGLAALAAAGLAAWWLLPTLAMWTHQLGDGHPINIDLTYWLGSTPALALSVFGGAGLIVGAVRNQTGARTLLILAGAAALLCLVPLQLTGTGRFVPIVQALLSPGVFLGPDPSSWTRRIPHRDGWGESEMIRDHGQEELFGGVPSSGRRLVRVHAGGHGPRYR